MSRRILAPGKVVLLGEYAVLDGAPAIVAAVDSGVACDVSSSDDLYIETPTEDDRFVAAALGAVDAPPGRYRFSSWNPVDLPSKPGLGGSAAAVVAAIRAARPTMPAPELFARALSCHRTVQGGGSGVDVAAAVWGGVTRFHQGVSTRVEVPHPLVVWSGRSARTGPRIQSYLRWKERGAFVDASRDLVERFVSDPIATLRAARRLLEDMADGAGIDYRTPTLTHISELAEAAGGAAKPSGAGGGDSAVAMFDTTADAERFARACDGAGYRVLDVRPSRGVHEANPKEQH